MLFFEFLDTSGPSSSKTSLLKVRKSQKGFMESSILPKNEQKNQKKIDYYDTSGQFFLFIFWEN